VPTIDEKDLVLIGSCTISDIIINEHQRSMTLEPLRALSLIHGLAESKAGLEKAMCGFPESAKTDPVYTRLKAYRDDISQILIGLKPTVTFQNNPSGVSGVGG
jgi:hypothetical protein